MLIGVSRIGRNNLDAIVVGLGVIDVNGLALEGLINHLGGLCSQQAGVLEHGVALFAGNDRLDGSNFGILAGHNRAGQRSGAVTNTLQGGENTDAEAIIGGQHAIDMLVGVVGAQKVVHASLGSCSQPAQGTDFVHAHLPTGDDDVATINVGLDYGHGAIIEIAGVRVIRRAAKQLDVEGALFCHLSNRGR